jgi:RNA polymerase sigma factor (TIGR02999 family)
MCDVTRVLQQIETGDPAAAEQLLPLVYEELRKLAAARMAQESPDHTLQATALVHEAYLRLVDGSGERHWKGRAHFFGAAAEAMRRILIDQARSRESQRRGAGWQRVPLEPGDLPAADLGEPLLAIDDVLDRLAAEDATAAAIVKLRYFVGMSVQEASDALGIGRTTAYEAWNYARAWLQCELSAPP